MSHASAPARSIVLQEITGMTLLRLHSLQSIVELRDALAAGSSPLPAEVNQCLGQDPAVLCLAPGEWLVCSERLKFRSLSGPLAASIDTRLTAILDVSAGFGVLRLQGCGVPWLLNKLCPLDIQAGLGREPDGGSHCSRTRLQQVGAVVHCRNSVYSATGPIFDLIVDRSVLHYTRQLLLASIPHAEHLNQTFGKRS